MDQQSSRSHSSVPSGMSLKQPHDGAATGFTPERKRRNRRGSGDLISVGQQHAAEDYQQSSYPPASLNSQFDKFDDDRVFGQFALPIHQESEFDLEQIDKVSIVDSAREEQKEEPTTYTAVAKNLFGGSA